MQKLTYSTVETILGSSRFLEYQKKIIERNKGVTINFADAVYVISRARDFRNGRIVDLGGANVVTYTDDYKRGLCAMVYDCRTPPE